MWRSRPAFPRNLLQLLDSRGGASSVCPSPSLFLARALRYSSKASPFSGIYRSVYRAFNWDLIFIKRKVQEDVVGRTGLRTTAAAESDQGSDDDSESDQDDSESDQDSYVDLDTTLRTLFPKPFHDDPAASMARISLQVCSNQTISIKKRHEAIEAIERLANDKPDSLEKYELVNPILQAMLPLLVVRGDDHDDDEGDDEQVFSSAARFVIEAMSLNHPEQVFPAVLEFASLSSQNTNPKYREAAVEALGDIAMGCSELMKDNLEPLLGIVLGAHRDAERRVREAASVALQHFVDHMQPEMVSRRQSVFPCLLNALDEEDDDDDFIERTSHESLESLCHYMTGDEILPYLDPIMNKLLEELQCGSYDRQLRSFTAMCSVAAAADQHFVPYAERVLEVLTRTGEPFLGTDNFVFWSVLVTTVGRAGAASIEAAVSAAAKSWNNGSGRPERRYTYGLFCNAAEALGDGFAKYLPGVVPLAISSCKPGEDSAATHSLLLKTLDEKAAATRALGLFAVHTKSAFAPYLEESMSVMINHSAHYHEDVRLQGVIGLKHLLTAAASVSESPSDGAAKAKEVLGTVMDHCIKAMDDDGDKRVVAQVCNNMVGILEDFGYAALEPYMPQITESALQLVQGQSACQRADDAEHDETLMAAVSNLLSALAKAATTSHFAPSMCSMFPMP